MSNILFRMKETKGLKNKVEISPNFPGMQHLMLRLGDTNLASLWKLT